MNNIKNKIAEIILYLTGLLFLISGLAKLMPVNPFEFLLVRQGLASWDMVPYLSRALIIFELVLGLNLIFNKPQRRIFIALSEILLLFFNIYLLIELITKGVEANCGCFGELIPMSTQAALVKNLIIGGVLVFPFYRTSKPEAAYYRLPLFFLLVTASLVFIFSPAKQYIRPEAPKAAVAVVARDSMPVKPVQPVIQKKEVTGTADEKAVKADPYPYTRSIFSKYNNFSTGRADLDRGQKIIVLFSLDCDHCLNTLKQLGSLKKGLTVPPVYGLFLGDSTQVKGFFDEAGTSIPYIILDPAEFFPFLKKSPPRVCLLINGNMVFNAEGDDFQINKLEQIITAHDKIR